MITMPACLYCETSHDISVCVSAAPGDWSRLCSVRKPRVPSQFTFTIHVHNSWFTFTVHRSRSHSFKLTFHHSRSFIFHSFSLTGLADVRFKRRSTIIAQGSSVQWSDRRPRAIKQFSSSPPLTSRAAVTSYSPSVTSYS